MRNETCSTFVFYLGVLLRIGPPFFFRYRADDLQNFRYIAHVFQRWVSGRRCEQVSDNCIFERIQMQPSAVLTNVTTEVRAYH